MSADGLTLSERGQWVALTEAVSRFAQRGKLYDAKAISRLGRQAWRIPVPGPRDEARMRLFRDLCANARDFDATPPGQVVAAMAVLEPLAAQCAAILDGGPTLAASALPTGDRD